jgi:exopolysaccharide biosynthesis polyprenyl glycosylphosphotransferase
VSVREREEVLLPPTPGGANGQTPSVSEAPWDVAQPSRRRGWLIRRLLLAADLVGIASAFLIAERVFNAAHSPVDSVSIKPELALFCLTLPLWALIAEMYGLYKQDDTRVAHTTVDEVVDVFHMVTVCTWGFFATAWVTHIAHPRIEKLLLFWCLAVIVVPITRSLVRVYARSTVTFLQNVVIVGAGDVGQTLAEKLVRHPEYGLNLVGFVDAEPKEQRPSLEHLAILGTSQQLGSIIDTYDIERVILAFSRDPHEKVRDILRALKDHWVQVDIVPRYFELMSPGPGLSSIEGIPLHGLAPRGLASSTKMLKRATDLVLGGLALVLLSPLLAAIAIAIRLDSRGPVFFRQPRVGQGGRHFRVLKFRTMVHGADKQKHAVASMNKHASRGGDSRMFKIASDPRVTRVGGLLRRRSLDELPQLFNVIRGEMSLVGPRPLIPEEDSYVDEWARRRLELKPGMTGLWQTLGRSDIPFEEMVRLDYIYVTSWSLWNDVKLLCLTVPLVLGGGRGAY